MTPRRRSRIASPGTGVRLRTSTGTLISKCDQIRMSEPGWFDVAGGKLTTYRLMAEQTVDRVCEYLGGNWRS
jgi:glycerol-3-phosphate dehydrogenase